MNTNRTSRNGKVYSMAVIALMTAITCVVAPFSVPIGPVPISLTTLAIYLSLYILGWKKAAVSCLLYILIGLAGVPVFSGFTGGIAKLLGPTGGYIIGYIPMALIAGLAIDKFPRRLLQFAGLIVGTAVCYAFGTAWFCFQSGSGLAAALSLCVFPFIPVDLVKMIIASIAAPEIRKRLDKAKKS